VFDHHGWGALGDELHDLSRLGRWDEMGGLVDDEVLRTFSSVGSVDEVAAMLVARFGDVVDRSRSSSTNVTTKGATKGAGSSPPSAPRAECARLVRAYLRPPTAIPDGQAARRSLRRRQR
jgi:hypothetical protein